jgi:predicted nucleotidyltransferase
MSHVVTVPQRKAREASRRCAAADHVMAELRAFGAAHGGRFLVFGSVAEGRMRFDSDFDVVVDFPADREAAAVDFVEEACRRQRLPVDIHLKSASSNRLLDRIRGHMTTLP